MNTPSSTIVQRLWNDCNILREKRRLLVEVGLVRAGRVRHVSPSGEAVLRSAFEGSLV